MVKKTTTPSTTKPSIFLHNFQKNNYLVQYGNRSRLLFDPEHDYMNRRYKVYVLWVGEICADLVLFFLPRWKRVDVEVILITFFNINQQRTPTVIELFRRGLKSIILGHDCCVKFYYIYLLLSWFTCYLRVLTSCCRAFACYGNTIEPTLTDVTDTGCKFISLGG